MHTSASRKYINKFLKPEILLQCSRDNLLGYNHKFPAQLTGIFALTAFSDIIIIIHIEIKYKLSLHWSELFVIFRWRACPNSSSI